MSPAASVALMNEVVPILKATVPRVVRTTGAEDVEELVQDGICQAAQMLVQAERKGPLPPSPSVAHYVIQSLKSGRRAGSAGRTDAMGPATQLDRRSAITSLDTPRGADEEDEGGAFLHMLDAGDEDPAQEAAREIDWAELVAALRPRQVAVLRATAEGRRLDALAKELGVSPPAVSQLKQTLADAIHDRWGDNALADALRKPSWHSNLNVVRERVACQQARRQAQG